MSAKSEKLAERKAAITTLRKLLKPGKTVYTVIRHVSSSGMTRHIDLYTIHKGQMRYLSGYASKALDNRTHNHGPLIVQGCGMDMCWNTVYCLSSVLYPKGFIPAKHKGTHARNGTPANVRDTDGGYALRHEHL